MRPERPDHAFFDNEFRPRLGTLMLEKGLLTEEQLDQALAERGESGELLGETLVRLGFIFEDELARVLGEQAGLPFANLDMVSVDRYAAATLPKDVADRLCALPVRFLAEGGLVVAVADPLDSTVLPQLQKCLNGPIELAVATASSIRRNLRLVPAA
jgi:Type II secretion system (T2SS), protein E, N-terminal domain